MNGWMAKWMDGLMDEGSVFAWMILWHSNGNNLSSITPRIQS